MQQGRSLAIFLITEALAAAFVWQTCGQLPDPVASHFDAAGAANGYMPRVYYTRLMLALVVGLPGLIVVLQSLAFASPKARINLPNRDYWLAPERREETVAFLRQHLARLGSMLVVLLTGMHWLVVKANAHQPPGLPGRWFAGAVILFVLATLVWLWALSARFRRIPR